MTGAEYLLDTSVVVAHLRGDPTAGERIRQATGLVLSVVVLSELLYGALRSAQPSQSVARVEALAARFPLLMIDAETARECARLRVHLAERGRPIPLNDLWIAASARRHGLVVATRDPHFQGIENLRIETW